MALGMCADTTKTFEVELKKPPGIRLGIEAVLAQSARGTVLAIENVSEGGAVEAWNRLNASPRQLRRGDLIIRVNNLPGDAKAMAEHLQSDGDLTLLIQRPGAEDKYGQRPGSEEKYGQRTGVEDKYGRHADLSASQAEQMPKNMYEHMPYGGMAGSSSMIGSAGWPKAVGGVNNRHSYPMMHGASALQHKSNGALGGAYDFAQQQMSAARSLLSHQGHNVGSLGHHYNQGYDNWTGNQHWNQAGYGGCGLAGVGSGSVAPFNNEHMYKFDIALQKTPHKPLGIDVISSRTAACGLIVQKIREDGVVDCWNRTCWPEQRIHLGDHIIKVNGQMAVEMMMDELRSRPELRITVLRRGSSDNQLVGVVTPGTAATPASSAPLFPTMATSKLTQAPTQPIASSHFGQSAQQESNFEVPVKQTSPPASAAAATPAVAKPEKIVFEAEILKKVDERLGLGVMLVNAQSFDGLMVESITTDGCVDRWNKGQRAPNIIMCGDIIVQVNNSAMKDALYLAKELDRGGTNIKVVIERGSPGLLKELKAKHLRKITKTAAEAESKKSKQPPKADQEDAVEKTVPSPSFGPANAKTYPKGSEVQETPTEGKLRQQPVAVMQEMDKLSQPDLHKLMRSVFEERPWLRDPIAQALDQLRPRIC